MQAAARRLLGARADRPPAPSVDRRLFCGEAAAADH